MVIDNCLCGAKMVLASNSRGFETFRCSRGCNFYQYDETKQKEESEHENKVVVRQASGMLHI